VNRILFIAVPIVPFISEVISLIRILSSNNQDGHEFELKELDDGRLPVLTGYMIAFFPLICRQMSFKFAFVLNYLLIGLYLSLLTIAPNDWSSGIVVFLMNGYAMFTRVSMDIGRRESFLSNQELQETKQILSEIQKLKPMPSTLLDGDYRDAWKNLAFKKLFKIPSTITFLFLDHGIVNDKFREYMKTWEMKENSYYTIVLRKANGSLFAGMVALSQFSSENITDHKIYSVLYNFEKKMQMFLDHEGVIEFATPSMVKFFQRGLEEMIGQSLPELLQLCGSPDHEAIQKRMDENDISVTIMRIGTKSFHITIKWIKDLGNEKLYGLVECFEMTQDSEELRMLKIANKVNKEFMEHTCHEVRNPLSVNVGVTEEIMDIANQLKDEESRKKILELCETSKACLNSISRTLDSTLSLEKMKSGQLTLNLFQFSFQKMMGEIVNIAQVNAKLKRLNFEWIVDEMLMRVEIVGDMKKLMEIMRNYLSNAMKFTKEGRLPW